MLGTNWKHLKQEDIQKTVHCCFVKANHNHKTYVDVETFELPGTCILKWIVVVLSIVLSIPYFLIDTRCSKNTDMLPVESCLYAFYNIWEL